MINEDTQKRVLISFLLILLIFGGIGWLIVLTEWISLANVGWFLLLITIGLAIWIGRHITSKSTKKWLRLIIVLCIALILNYISWYQDNDDKKKSKTSETPGKSVKITSQKPTVLTNPSEVASRSWGKLVHFTGYEPDGIKLCEGNENINYRKLKIKLIGGPGILDHAGGYMWPIWGADGFIKPEYRKDFFYPDVAPPNAVLVVLGKPGDAPAENVFRFKEGETEMTIEAPGDLPVYLYYHELRTKVGDRYPSNDNNSGYFTFEVTIEEF